MRSKESMDRRTFLKYGSVGSASAAASLLFRNDGWAQDTEAVPVSRTLGRTGLKVNVIGLGAMRTTEPSVMQAAFERGVNYVDTARGYLSGNNERIVGEALKGRRDKVYVATKFKIGSKQDMLAQFEQSLRSLDVDYVDVLQVHNLRSKEEAMNAEAKEVLAQLKQEGKVRFTGVTTHGNEVEVVDSVIDDPDKFFDIVLVKYNFLSSPEIKAVIARAAQANIGVVAMKTQAKTGYQGEDLGDLRPHPAALKWVLQDTNVALAVPGMLDLAEVMENTAVMRNLEMTAQDRRALERYGAVAAARYCRLCGECGPTCPYGVDIYEVNRSLMYAKGYGDIELARETYREIPAQCSASACISCEKCAARCGMGFDVAARMREARELFA